MGSLFWDAQGYEGRPREMGRRCPVLLPTSGCSAFSPSCTSLLIPQSPWATLPPSSLKRTELRRGLQVPCAPPLNQSEPGQVTHSRTGGTKGRDTLVQGGRGLGVGAAEPGATEKHHNAAESATCQPGWMKGSPRPCRQSVFTTMPKHPDPE